jgi:hypothetical protein
MFAKTKISQSMIDAVNSVIEGNEEVTKQALLDEAAEKVPTPTGMRVYGTSYGNSAKARKDQTKAAVDTLKGPKDKELIKDDEIDETGFHAAAHGAKKAGQSHFEFQGKKYPVTAKSHAEAVSEEGDCVTKPQAKDIAKKEVGKHEKGMHGKSGEVAKHEKKMHKEEMTFAEKLKSIAENKSSGPQETFTDNNLGEEEMTDAQMKKREKIVMSMKDKTPDFKQRYGKNWKNVMYATATKQAMAEETEDLEEATPPKNTDIADKAYLKHKPGTVKGTMTQIGRFLRGKPEIKEDVVTEAEVVTKASDPEEVTTDMLSGREKGGKANSFKSFKLQLRTDGEMKGPDADEPAKTKARASVDTNDNTSVTPKLDDKLATPPKVRAEEVEQVEEKVIAGTPGWEKIKGTDKEGNIKDKSGAVHTPMSRAKDLARQSFKKLKKETMMGKISN